MSQIKRLISLPEDLATRLDKETNKSGTVQDALRLYWEWRDQAKALINSSGRVLDLLENPKQTINRLPKTMEDEINTYRRNYPNGIFFERDGEVWVRNKFTGKEMLANELEENS